ncbi:MAG: HAD-IIB family hydrolase [bacterium]|nr:HAD-IIB family hydrolase [bacterium]
MRKKVIAFDLDGTLAPSKSPMPDQMSDLLNQLMDKFHICVISGGKFEQFQKQLLNNLKAEPAKLVRLHLMPTCGTRYYRFDPAKEEWQKIYAEDFTKSQKNKIIIALNKAFDESGFREARVYGDVIEDRGSQITLSTLGQDVVDELGEKGVELKEVWDPDSKKKQKIRDLAAAMIPEFEVRVGGLTSVDVTRRGIDKAYGMRKLMDMLKIGKNQIFFIGDRLAEGGNDYPVKAFGIECMEINHWEETAEVIETIIRTS